MKDEYTVLILRNRRSLLAKDNLGVKGSRLCHHLLDKLCAGGRLKPADIPYHFFRIDMNLAAKIGLKLNDLDRHLAKAAIERSI
ncbi:hypothetical protein D3C78_1466600 [compost metagenome]